MSGEQATQKQLDDLRAEILRAISDLKETITNQAAQNREDIKDLRDKTNKNSQDIATIQATIRTIWQVIGTVSIVLAGLQFILQWVIK